MGCNEDKLLDEVDKDEWLRNMNMELDVLHVEWNKVLVDDD